MSSSSARSARSSAKARRNGQLDPMEAPVSNIMSKKVASVRPDTSLEVAMEVLMTRDISHLPVVEDGQLCGVLSKTDLVRERFMNGQTEERETMKVSNAKGLSWGPGAGFHEDGDAVRTVADIMSAKVRTIEASGTIAQAAITMSKFRVHGLPVVNAAGGLVGFVSTLDVVRWVAQPRE